jgi:16S rRNA G966 N2-methylase RsmD
MINTQESLPLLHNLNYKLSILNNAPLNNALVSSNIEYLHTKIHNSNVCNEYENFICSSNINFTAKRDFLFRFLQPHVRNQLKMDEEALYSTTDQLTADRISKDLLKFIPCTSTITDATACIGGTAYSFSQFFNTVNAIEIDPNRYVLMVHNLSIMLKDVEISNINCYNNNSLILCKTLKQQAIFIDPPWGGPDYKQVSKLSLYLSDLELSVVCKQLYLYTDYLVIKVPTNFDEELFINNTKNFMTLVHKNTSLRKIYLLIFNTSKKT